MYSIASLLDPSSDQAVRSIWARFENECGLTGIKVTPLPHFSWQSADAYQVEPVGDALAKIAETMEPFSTLVTGLGIFTGPQPVIYLPIVKNPMLVDIHQILWDQLRPFAVVPNLHYDPERWLAHITLAYHETDPQRLGCAVVEAAMQPLSFEIYVDHFAILFQTDGRAGLHSRFEFGGNSHEKRGQ
jgi:2'-5' RNA ligase